MRARSDLLVVMGVVAIVAVLACVAPRLLPSRDIALYPGNLPSAHVNAITRYLDKTGVRYTLDDGRIKIAPDERRRIVGTLLSHGLPRPPEPVCWASTVPEMTPEKIRDLEPRLVEDLLQVEGVTTAHVAITPDDDMPLRGKPKPWATVRLTFRPGHKPARPQIEAIQAHVTWSAGFQTPLDIEVIDATDRTRERRRP